MKHLAELAAPAVEFVAPSDWKWHVVSLPQNYCMPIIAGISRGREIVSLTEMRPQNSGRGRSGNAEGTWCRQCLSASRKACRPAFGRVGDLPYSSRRLHRRAARDAVPLPARFPRLLLPDPNHSRVRSRCRLQNRVRYRAHQRPRRRRRGTLPLFPAFTLNKARRPGTACRFTDATRPTAKFLI